MQASLCLHVQETLLETPGRPPDPEGHNWEGILMDKIVINSNPAELLLNNGNREYRSYMVCSE